jgi:mannose-6-phosphate isomerase
MFLPSGRVHAIGAGLVIFEIQQNSDTTFRVYDWDRVGLDGRPRDLHVQQSLESIDFDDFEPSLIRTEPVRRGAMTVRPLVDHPLFRIDLVDVETKGEWRPRESCLQVLACVDGSVTLRGGGMSDTLQAGDFCLLPAGVADAMVSAETRARLLLVEAGR